MPKPYFISNFFRSVLYLILRKKTIKRVMNNILDIVNYGLYFLTITESRNFAQKVMWGTEGKKNLGILGTNRSKYTLWHNEIK
jgi:hypothetical protein